MAITKEEEAKVSAIATDEASIVVRLAKEQEELAESNLAAQKKEEEQK